MNEPKTPNYLRKILQTIFPKKSKWIDIYMFEDSGRYKLIQMRYRLDNNKKKFRTASIGFVNDYTVKFKIYENVLLERNDTTSQPITNNNTSQPITHSDCNSCGEKENN